MSPEFSRLQQLTYAVCMPVCSAAFANRECLPRADPKVDFAPFQPPTRRILITEFARGIQPLDSRCDAICSEIAGSPDYHHPLNVRKLHEVFKERFPGGCPPRSPILVPEGSAEPAGLKVKVDVTTGASRRIELSPVILQPSGLPIVLARIGALAAGISETVSRNKTAIFHSTQNALSLLLGVALFYFGVRGQLQPNIYTATVDNTIQA